MIFDATTKDRIGLSLPGIDAFLLVLRCAPLRRFDVRSETLNHRKQWNARSRTTKRIG